MKVFLFHPTLLPPRNYGGVERVVLWLAQGLVERGHEVTVGASPGSLLPEGVKLLEIFPGETSYDGLLKKLPLGTDVVHLMAPLGGFHEELWEKAPFPYVMTIHGNGKPGERFPKNTVFLSRNHAERHGAEAFVYNGIDPKEYLFGPEKGVLGKESAFLFFSKTSLKVKNLSGCMQLCANAGVPLTIAGGHRPLSLRLKAFFHSQMSWAGPVSGMQKARLLSEAKALLFPVTWNEPFGLSVVEALISGTPVIASPQGSLSELVPNSVGRLIPLSDEAGWIECLRSPLPWSPDECRKWALERFHYLLMAENYEKIYEKVSGILSENMLNKDIPQTREGEWSDCSIPPP